MLAGFLWKVDVSVQIWKHKKEKSMSQLRQSGRKFSLLFYSGLQLMG
jgi:hypothetical protein